jgi:hypothetical protein
MVHLRCVVIAICVVVDIASSADPTAKTLLALYRDYRHQPGDAAEGYSLFVNGPMTLESRSALAARRPGSIFVSYVNMVSVEEGVTAWADDVMKNSPDCLLENIGGKKDGSLPLRRKYVWGYLHPYDSSRSTRSRFLTDPSSPSWREYLRGIVRKQLKADPVVGHRGIFLDNVWPFYTMFFERLPKDLQVDMNGDGVMDRSDDWAWADAVIGLSRTLRAEVGDSVVLIGNFGTRWDNRGTAFHILSRGAFDGVMNEGFAHNDWGSDSSSYPSREILQLDIDALIIADSLGKIALAQSFGREDDDQARLFSFAAFLLGACDQSYFNYRYRTSYDTLYRFPECDVSIGHPMTRYALATENISTSQFLYTRVYSSGIVYLNMGDQAEKLSLPSGSEVLSLHGGIIAHGGNAQWVSCDTLLLSPRAGSIVRIGH